MLSIEEFLEVKRAEGVGSSAVRNTRVSLTQLNEYKPLDEIEYMDIVKFINHIRDTYGYAESTITLRRSCIKNYFKFHDRDDITKKLEIKRVLRDLNPADILDPEDINYLLEHMKSPLYKAIITFLFESGARINEALAVKLDTDIKEINVGYDLTLFGDKTRKHNYKYREMILIESAPYIREWLMVRNSDSPYLFPLTDRSVNEWLKHLRETLHFKKPLNPHAYRHGCATRLVKKGMQESLIRKQMGWSANSTMLAVYIHLADTDLKTYQLMQSGEITEETPMVEIIKPAETAMDRISKQEQDLNALRDMVQALMKEKLEREPLLDSLTQHHSEYFPVEDIRPDTTPTPVINKSLKNIKEAVTDFNIEKEEAPQTPPRYHLRLDS
jgi:site-specific recombinase XerD